MSHVSSIAKEKYSKLAEAVFIWSYKFADISSILVATVFLVNDKSLKRCSLSGHEVSTVFSRQFFFERSISIRLSRDCNHLAKFIAGCNSGNATFADFFEAGLLLI